MSSLVAANYFQSLERGVTVPKLHEVVAVATGKKAEVQKSVTDSYHLLQKAELFDGLRKVYQPIEEGGEQLPSESKNPQADLRKVVADAKGRWRELFDVTMAVDAGNQVAKADVEVDGKVLAKDVPVPTLLFLEKQLGDVKAFLEKLPVPDPAERWAHDSATGLLATEPTKTGRTKKVQKPIVLFPATEQHPAQTQLITEDLLAGYWTTIRYTHRVSADKKSVALDRVGKLLDAVKVARERANSTEVSKREIGESLLGFVFDGLK